MNAHESLSSNDIEALNARCYNAKADYWDRMPFADFLPAQILLHHNPSAGMKALDIGSGTGLLAEWLSKQGFILLCLDPSDEMVKRCQQKNLPTLQTTIQKFSTDEPRPKGRGMIWGEFRTPPKFGVELPGPKGPGLRGLDEKFGLVLAVLSFIHLSKNEFPIQLNRVANWLNPKGTFVLALIEGTGEGVGEKNSDYPRYFSYYTHEEVLELTRKDFNCVFESRATGPISYLVFIFQKKN